MVGRTGSSEFRVPSLELGEVSCVVSPERQDPGSEESEVGGIRGLE
jgi:hypothetical protein